MCISDVRCVCKIYGRRAKGRADCRRLENGANPGDMREKKKIGERAMRVRQEEKKGLKELASGTDALAWKRPDRSELARVFGQLKREIYLQLIYIGRILPISRFYRNAVFFS